MAHIDLPSVLQGKMGILQLFAISPETAQPLTELTDTLLHQERKGSTINQAERELIATYTSKQNQCTFCTMSHCAVTANLFHKTTDEIQKIVDSPEESDLSDKMKALLKIVKHLTVNGKDVTKEHIDKAKELGATDMDLHDTVMITALFCFYNRYVDGLGLTVPENQEEYLSMGDMLAAGGYTPMKPKRVKKLVNFFIRNFFKRFIK